ncbi:glycosyltransferase family 4 protein [Roseateles sp.]|uniref:glycosyltransferase family 4 protein n=1 Tax=Roseateles sp. TaxID=1971397 RepID=UPI003BA719F0
MYNTPDLADLSRFQEEMGKYGLENRVEFVFASQWLRDQAGIPGEVHPSIIDVKRFCPRPKRPTSESFVVGRLSRDVLEKHHPDDPDLWIDLAKRGFRVRLMGATCLLETLGNQSGIEVLPVGAESAESFLQSLDAFVYRTDSSRFIEPSGRVVLEALSCGVPVVCDREGGYREVIVDGSNGLYADDSAEIMTRLEALRANSDLLRSLARQGRRYVEDLFSESAMADMNKFFIE